MMLIGGFGVGQGSIFLVQTLLVVEGRLDLLASFGLHFSFAILGILLVDWGSLTVLARETASRSADGAGPDSIWRAYWAMVPIRLLVALAVIATGVVYGLTLDEGFGRSFVLGAIPAALIWSFNANGVLDGLKLSGVSGATGSLPYLTVAAALFFTRDWVPDAAGLTTGLSLAAGYLATIIIQQIAIAAAGVTPRFVRPSAREIWTLAQQGFASSLSLLPGQLYFRFQLTLSATFLGTDATAIFVYAKQVIVAMAQLIGFLRRIEFPDLIAALRRPTENVVATIIGAQRLGTAVAVAATLLFILGGLIVGSVWDTDLGKAGSTVALFAPVIFTSAIGLCLQQGMFALGMFHRAASLRLATSVFGAAASAVLIAPFGLAGIMLADAALDIAFIVVAVLLLARRPRVAQESPAK